MQPITVSALSVVFLSLVAGPALANPVEVEGSTPEPVYELTVPEGAASSYKPTRFYPAADQPGEEAMGLASDAIENHRYDHALAHFRTAAEKGNVVAQRIAGMMLVYGESIYGAAVARNSTEGIHLLRQAAGQGCKISHFVVGRMEGNIKHK